MSYGISARSVFRRDMGVFHLAKTFRNFHGNVHRVKNMFHVTQVPFAYTLVTKIQNGGTDIVWIAWNWWFSWEMKLVNGTCISTEKFPAGKQDYLFKIPPIPGNFSVERTENAWARFRNFLVAHAANTYNRMNQSLKAKCRLNIQWTNQNLK